MGTKFLLSSKPSILMLLDVASDAGLKALGKSWQWSELATKIAMKQAQLSDNAKTLKFRVMSK